jgi:hypothetical protein
VARHRLRGATHVYSGEQTPLSLSLPAILSRPIINLLVIGFMEFIAITFMGFTAVICGFFTAFIFRRLPVVLIVSISAVAGMATEVFMFGGNMNMRELFTAGLPSAIFGYVFHRLLYANTKPSNPAMKLILIFIAAVPVILLAVVLYVVYKISGP